MVYQRLSLVAAVVLLVGGCSQSDEVSVGSTVAVTQTTTTQTITTTTEFPSTTEAPSTTQAVTESSTVDAGVSQCEYPAVVTVGKSEQFVDLHQAVEAVVEHTNTLGLALLGVEDFSPGWENEEPVASVVEELLGDLETVEKVSGAVLVKEFGATYDQEAVSWVFPESMWPISPELGQLEELAMSSDLYRDDILPLMFSMTTLHDAVGHWNFGASPCGHANGMVERLESARSLFST